MTNPVGHDAAPSEPTQPLGSGEPPASPDLSASPTPSYPAGPVPAQPAPPSSAAPTSAMPTATMPAMPASMPASSTPAFPGVAYPPVSYPGAYAAAYPGMPAPGAPAATSGSRTAVIVLSAVLGLFVLISGGLAALYVRQTSQSADRIESLQVEKGELQRRLDLAERDLSDAEDDLDDATDEKDNLTGCLESIFDWLDTEPGSAAEDAAFTEAQAACRKAGY